MDFIIPSVIGLISGVLLSLVMSFWILLPARVKVRRGYTNAVAVGILLAAAIEFIPITFSEVGFVGSGLLDTYIILPLNPQPNTALWVLTRSGQLQAVIQAILASGILILFFNGNAAAIAAKDETAPDHENSQAPPVGWRAKLALPPLEDQADQVGIIIVLLGLFCYSLWLGATHMPSPGTSSAQLFIGLVLTILFGAILGITIVGLIPDLSHHWRWIVGGSTLLGLAMIFGLASPTHQIVLTMATPLLLGGTICLVYGIGRLLGILQYQIGTGWRTTLTVLATAGVIYQSNHFISRLI